jgi:lipopolysaccharide/colanic/teichoic acid biosynthesis glycosyltransferase
VPPDPRPRAARAAKRALDVALAALLLALAAPVIALAAAAIRLETPGAVVYRQRRVGRGGREFDLLKLRTMVSGAETMGAGLAVDEGDPRITRVGALLRRWSLDELPNLLNVLRGDMSIVGPRPTFRYQVEQYDEHQRRRLEVRPGLTGWAQVQFPYGASEEDALRKLEYDLYYVKNMNALMDTMIVLQTIKTVLFRKGGR